VRYFVTLGGRTLVVDLSGPTPTVDGKAIEAELAAVPGTAVRHLIADNRSYTLLAHPGVRRGQWDLAVRTERFSLDVVDERTHAIREMTGGAEVSTEKVIAAPMPGLVVRIEVEPGQQVKAGQGVVVVEAMKMENELKAPADGVVARIEVKAGQTVNKGATLLVLE
jgi:biotin carboxyl carrier protein